MPKITDLLRSGPTLSFEFSAPRDEEGARRLNRTLARLARLQPSFMSVTYGAGGSSRGPTAQVVHHIRHDLGVTAMPHLTCVAHTRDEIGALLDAYRDDGVENLLALHGDLPEGGADTRPGQFTRAIDLVAFARERASFAIGVAAHPEGHPMAAATEADREHQAAKLRAADFGMTQFFFRVEYYERFMEEMQARGVETPVIPGVMPPTNIEGVGRMAAMNNTEFPAEIVARLETAGEDVNARREIAVEVATRLGEGLLAAGAPGLHLYTMNFSDAVRAVVANLGLRPGLD
ncbi:MAG: methylenetetrahydrofolate reductase [Chloroflexi bacterium]|nr:methylenetetrahydrofolate reductase [Chloroflexota bacterium]MDA1241418.1 methylenetetrahydrofolate reductase [Chloroflexota bacterium]